MSVAFRQNYTFTITNGTSLSGTVDLGAGVDFGGSTCAGTLFTPAGWDVAALSIQLSQDGVTFAPLYNSTGAESSVASAITASTVVPALSGTLFSGTRYVRFRSGTNAAPVNQTADRTFTLILSRAA